MDTKITLSQLARIVAKKQGIPQKMADTFLKEFFDSVAQNVKTDKLVKIKGLGTFKLIEVLDRESVNVHTGERIVIPGHTKLSFTPDAVLRDTVNKPFADFQTVIINEETDLAEMERVPEEELETASEPEMVEEELLPEEPIEPKEEEAPQMEEEKPAAEPEVVVEEQPVVQPEKQDEVKQKEQPVEVVEEQKIKEVEVKKSQSKCETFVKTLGVLLLCVLSYTAGQHNLVEEVVALAKQQLPKQEIVEEPQVEVQPEVVEIPVDTTEVVVVEEPQDTVAVEPVEEVVAADTLYAQVPDGKFRIVGTWKTHVMKSGDYINRIALREYGDKDMAEYIIVHNAFPNPDNVPIGAEIKLPKLEEVK